MFLRVTRIGFHLKRSRDRDDWHAGENDESEFPAEHEGDDETGRHVRTHIHTHTNLNTRRLNKIKSIIYNY